MAIMNKNTVEILAYITGDEKRVITGNPLTLFITDENERKTCVADLGKALKANVLQLKNGDYLLISSE